jgi:hypothetical protein
MDTSIRAIETRYAGCRFRSRLEARWAVFFDTLGVEWEYEPQGFKIGTSYYLPDFLLTHCGTWVEVKGSEDALDKDLMRQAAADLPRMQHGGGEEGPRLLLLGPIPDVTTQSGDLGWMAPLEGRYGFGSYYKNRRPWYHDGPLGYSFWLTPTVHHSESISGARAAYLAARSARFEHGESG